MPRTFVSIAASIMLLASVAIAAEEKPDPRKEIAGKYFAALFSGDAEKASALCAVPFSMDRKKVLETKEEVDAMHKDVATKKGKRELPAYTIEKTDAAPKLDEKVFPKYVAYRVTVGGEHVDVYVTQGDDSKVIGFSD
jgi:hypothetical protein